MATLTNLADAVPSATRGSADVLLRHLSTVVPNLEVGVAREVADAAARRGLTVPWALLRAGLVEPQHLGRAAGLAAGLSLLAEICLDALTPAAVERNSSPVLRAPALVLGRSEAGSWQVAVADPFAAGVVETVRRAVGRDAELLLVDETTLANAVRELRARHALAAPQATSPVDDVPRAVDERDLEADGPAARLVDALIAQAAEQGASDIHLEPTADGLRVRFRVDGVLREVQGLRTDHAGPGEDIRRSTMSRLKVLGGLKIDETRAAHSGRVRRRVGAHALDLRLEIIPVVVGSESYESAVLRLLAAAEAPPTLEALGFSEPSRAAFERITARPQGLVLVVGPTGSGKSTTLFACLSQKATSEHKVLTVEDPVEHRLLTAQQVEVIAGKITFATALRSFMRQDPDIVLVGETRDRETAQTACEAALTGHLVFTSLHTNSAAESPLRLVEMGVEPFLVANTLSGVVSQRLVRRLCHACRRPASDAEAAPVLARWPLDELPPGSRLWRSAPGGCGRCNGSGYHGRTAVSEVLEVTDANRLAILRGMAASELHAVAVREGMVPIRIDAMSKVLNGETSLEEVHRVVL
jgi:general secretion pathway protein E